jgi:hypothetical protein
MCRQTTCEKCGKTTWAGCGAHVDAVMANVPADRRCRCRETPRKKDAAPPALNVGPVDRVLRVALGLIAIMFASTTPWAWLGFVPLFTGLVGFCPLYRLAGWSTRPGRA